MDTLGTTTPKVIRKEESWSINDSYPAGAAMPKGTIVKLNTTNGKVEPIAAVADLPFGIVSSGAKKVDDLVTVQTQFNAIVRAKAGAADLTTGDYLSAKALDSTEGVMEYEASTAGQVSAAIALEDAVAGETVWVGVLRTFVKHVV